MKHYRLKLLFKGKGHKTITLDYYGDSVEVAEERAKKRYNDYFVAEVKKIPIFTDAEKIILENVRKEYKYIFREKNGRLMLSGVAPTRMFDSFWSMNPGGDLSFTIFDEFNHLFQDIQWEDEPYRFREEEL